MKKIAFVFVGLLIIFLFVNNIKVVGEFPKYTHAWAQADRYALSLGFIDNGFDFFHPQTFVLNHQFPGEFKIPSDNSITSVDFPIHEYVVSLLMKMFNYRGPLIFRLYILIYSIIGLFFLFKSSLLLTKSYSKSTFVLLFAASSPIFLYYQSGFLPSIPSLSNVFIGIYFYIKYFQTNNIKSYYWSIVFLTLSSLSRTPFSIYIISLLCIQILLTVKRFRIEWKVVIPLLTSILVVGSYFFYNTILRERYGSMFLNHPMIPSSIQEMKDIISVVREKWIYEYFTKGHYIYIVVLSIIGIILTIRNRRKISTEVGWFGLFLIVVYLGVTSYSFLMMKQFYSHDYYFLDTFFIPIVLTLLFVLYLIPSIEIKKKVPISIIGILILCIPLFIIANNTQKSKKVTGFWSRANTTIDNFQDSKLLLNSSNVNTNDKILVLDAYAPNIPFILMDRYGYVVMTTSKENIKESLSWKYDYLVFQNEYFLSDIYFNYPEIVNNIHVLSTDDKISVCRKSDIKSNISLMEFLGLDTTQPVLVEKLSFDSLNNPNWNNINITNVDDPVGEHSGYIRQSDDFGISYKVSNPTYLKSKNRYLFIRGQILSEIKEFKETYFVVSIKGNESDLYYNLFDLGAYNTSNKDWNNINLSYHLPQIDEEDYKLSIYIWNKGRNELYYDDIEIIVY